MSTAAPSGGRARLVALVVALLALVGLAAPAGAQQGPAVEVTGIDLSAFPEVRLRFALGPGVTDRTLDADAIDVTENGAPVDEVVTPLTDQVISVMLAVDTSGSMDGDPLAQAKVAAIQLLDVLPADARVGVIGFSDDATLVSAFTTERDASRAALNDLAAGGGTSLYDAVVLAAEQVRASDADRTAILVLSDGADSGETGSDASLEEAATAAADSGADVYAVSLQTDDSDPAALSSLVEPSDGRVVQAAEPDALAAAYLDLGQRIVNQYEVVFVSTTAEATATYTIGVAGTDAATEVALALPDRAGGPGDAPTTTVERALPEPLVTSVEPGPLEQDWALYVGAGLVAVAIAITASIVAQGDPNRPRERRSLRTDADIPDGANAVQRTVATARAAVTGLTSRAVARTESQGSIDAKLDRAGIVMRAGEFVAAVLATAVAAGVLGYLFLGAVGLALGVAVPILGANAFLGFKAQRRNSAFADQLSDTLLILSGSLRSGFGVGQAIDTVAEEMEPPMSTEFRRAILETRLGRDLEDALDGVARRVQNEDFEWVVDAMRINRQVGGDLASILDQVSETIRSRNRLKRQVAALTAEGRISALVLFLLPIGLGLVLYSSNPEYMDPLFDRTAGQIALGLGIALLVAGGLWLRKMIDIEY